MTTRNLFVALALLVLGPGLTACGPGSSTPEPGSAPAASAVSSGGQEPASGGPITPAEVHARIAAGETVILLDVRTPEENAQVRIPGSILIPHEQVAAQAAARLPDRDAFIAVYCRSGRRSGLAIQDLQRLGYTRVYNLGGIGDWPYATEP